MSSELEKVSRGKWVMPGGQIVTIHDWLPTDLVVRTDAKAFPRIADKQEYLCFGAEILTEEDLPPNVLFRLMVGGQVWMEDAAAVSLCARALCERDHAAAARLTRLEAAVYGGTQVMPAQGVFAKPVYISGGDVYRVELTEDYAATVRLFGLLKRRVS